MASGSGSVCLGCYFPVEDKGYVGFRSLGWLPHDAIKGSLSSIAALSVSRCFAVGSTSGSLSIVY